MQATQVSTIPCPMHTSQLPIPLKLEIPGQNKVIPGSLDTPSKLVKSLDCPGHPWTVGNYDIDHVWKSNLIVASSGTLNAF